MTSEALLGHCRTACAAVTGLGTPVIPAPQWLNTTRQR